MKNLSVKYQTKKVDVIINNNLLLNINKYLDVSKRYLIVTDENLENLHLNKLKKQLNNSIVYVIKASEHSKNYQEVLNIINKMLEINLSKNDYIIAFGGGVVGDLTGFVTSIYKRGINYINIPTTLIAQVDSSLGGKTGIDFSYNNHKYKNQIGSIYHPEKILVDPTLLKTLPKREYLSGLGEVIKYGLCFDEDLFNCLFTDFDIEEVVYKCLKIKAEVTSIDEFEKNIRFALNFGHTIGHAIESLSNFEISHGLAVSIGMFYEVENELIKNKLQTLYNKLGIDLNLNFKKDEFIEYIQKDKKIENQEINLPVLEKIGKVKIIKINLNDFIRGIK